MKVVLISTYELGHQPFGLASPAAWLAAAGWSVALVDASKDRLGDDALAGADLIGFYLPMHTATRLAAPIIGKARAVNPSARICAYGLYAPLNADWLRGLGVDEVFGGEFEEDLAHWAGTDRKQPQRPQSTQRKCFTQRPSAVSACSAVPSYTAGDTDVM